MIILKFCYKIRKIKIGMMKIKWLSDKVSGFSYKMCAWVPPQKRNTKLIASLGYALIFFGSPTKTKGRLAMLCCFNISKNKLSSQVTLSDETLMSSHLLFIASDWLIVEKSRVTVG
jgi:hypothetical protein